MNNTNFIKDYCSNFFKIDISKINVVKRFFGGKSNSMYLVSIEDKLYTFRIPGSNAELFVNRLLEIDNLNEINKLSISNKTIYINKDTGITISEYIEGADLTNNVGLYPFISELLKKLHMSNVNFKNDYEPFKRLTTYENLNQGIQSNKKYVILKKLLYKYEYFLKLQMKVAAHNDFQPANIIKDANDKLFLIDWEFSGNNDPIYDIACFGNINLDNSISLLKEYFTKPSKEEYKRLYLWRMFQCLQWFNVATYKDKSGLSKELNIDFKAVAAAYLDKAEYLSKLIN